MKKIIWISIGSALTIVAIIAIILAFPRDYRVSRENSYIPYHGAVDLYNASREELIELDLVDYPEAFGEVKSEEEAFQIADKIVKEIYEQDESPYIVKFNKNADAWIVSGSLPMFRVGGVASIAIARETGEILMVIHTK